MEGKRLTSLSRSRICFLFRCRGISPIFLAPLMAFVIAGCSQRNATAHVPPAPTSSASPSAGIPASTPPNAGTSNAGSPNTGTHIEEGLASWYGVPYHGRRASDGEIYDMYKLTAAHRTLPFNTMVRVTNLANGQQVDVRIIDRGPFVEDRIIDLSLAAARVIDMVGAGTARVRVEVLSSAPNPTAGRFAVQVGAFSDRANAERLRDQLAASYQPISIQDFAGPTGRLFRVRVGSVPNESEALQLATKLQAAIGLQTFVVRVDDVPQIPAPGGDVQP